jgi:hypothetical protein
MLNCKRLYADPQSLVHRMADLLKLDRDRLRLWLLARCVPRVSALAWSCRSRPSPRTDIAICLSLLTPAIRIHRAPLESAGLMQKQQRRCEWWIPIKAPLSRALTLEWMPVQTGLLRSSN